MHLDVLALLGQSEYAFGTFAVAAADVQMHLLVAAARRREVAAHRPQRPKLKTCFLHRLTARDLLRLFVLVDQSGHQLDQPGVVRLVQCSGTELLDQHHLVAPGVIGQHADGIVPNEQLAFDLRTHLATEQAVAQLQALQAIETAETLLSLQDLDIIGAGFEGIAHGSLTSRFVPCLRRRKDCNRHIVSGLFVIILARRLYGRSP